MASALEDNIAPCRWPGSDRVNQTTPAEQGITARTSHGISCACDISPSALANSRLEAA